MTIKVFPLEESILFTTFDPQIRIWGWHVTSLPPISQEESVVQAYESWHNQAQMRYKRLTIPMPDSKIKKWVANDMVTVLSLFHI